MNENAIHTPAADGVVTSPIEASDPYGRLIVAIAQGRDREAFAQLFQHFAPRLKSWLMRAGANAAAAEDFAQEAMLTVWRKAELYDPARAGASAWIFTIARNLRIDSLRRDARGIPDIDLSEMPDPPARPDDALFAATAAGRIRTALQTLPREQAEVVRLSFFQEKAHAEIAKDLGLPLGTVKSRMRLAMTRLRTLLGDLS